MLKGFEKPADQGNIQSDIRAGYAEGIYELYHGGSDAQAETSKAVEDGEDETVGVLPKSMISSDVQAKACLIALYLKDILKLLEEIEV